MHFHVRELDRDVRPVNISAVHFIRLYDEDRHFRFVRRVIYRLTCLLVLLLLLLLVLRSIRFEFHRNLHTLHTRNDRVLAATCVCASRRVSRISPFSLLETKNVL